MLRLYSASPRRQKRSRIHVCVKRVNRHCGTEAWRFDCSNAIQLSNWFWNAGTLCKTTRGGAALSRLCFVWFGCLAILRDLCIKGAGNSCQCTHVFTVPVTNSDVCICVLVNSWLYFYLYIFNFLSQSSCDKQFALGFIVKLWQPATRHPSGFAGLLRHTSRCCTNRIIGELAKCNSRSRCYMLTCQPSPSFSLKCVCIDSWSHRRQFSLTRARWGCLNQPSTTHRVHSH